MAGKQGRVPFLVRLRGVEVRCRRPHPGDGLRTRRARHHRQLRLPRVRRNPHAVKGTRVGGAAARHHHRRRPDDDDRRHPAAAGWNSPRTSHERWRSCCPTTPASSPVRRSPSTAAPTWTRPPTRRIPCCQPEQRKAHRDHHLARRGLQRQKARHRHAAPGRPARRSRIRQRGRHRRRRRAAPARNSTPCSPAAWTA